MEKKNLILDTTFILPLFGIKVINLPDYQKFFGKMWKEGLDGFYIYLPSPCLIEVMFKLINEYKKQKNFEIINRYPLVLPSITKSEIIQIINPIIDPIASTIAIKLRHAGHSDLMDCWIGASAAKLNGILLTEDKELRDSLSSIPETKGVVVWFWKNFIDEFTSQQK